MKRRIDLIAAPPAIQPGGYVNRAYADRVRPITPWVNVQVDSRGAGFRILLSWPCPKQVTKIVDDVDRFPDAAALLAPATPDAPMMTMGSADAAVDGWFWRADREASIRVRAHGLGTMERLVTPTDASVGATWANAHWGVQFELPSWPSISAQQRIGVAIWRGADAERAGLKSVTPNWIPLH